MAIEKVYIANNTSVIQDEVLATGLGCYPSKRTHGFLITKVVIVVTHYFQLSTLSYDGLFMKRMTCCTDMFYLNIFRGGKCQ